MKIFIDSADINEIKKAKTYGVLDGLTTNPTLIAKTGRGFETVAKELLDICPGPVSLEVVATDAPGIVKQGRQLRSWGKQVVVKVPLIAAGLEAVKILSEEQIPTNVTLCFSTTQAWLAAKAGATYISPFIGRLDDISTDGLTLIQDIRNMYDQYGFTTQLLAASIRHPMHVVECLRMGADVGTMPLKVVEQLMGHPLTEKGLELFLKDWSKVPGADQIWK